MNALPPLAKAGFAALPTPLQELKNLSRVLGPRIFVKRDDLTGLGFGGNKVRKLEYLVPQIVASGSDCVVTGAFFQSNWCTAVAAATRRIGLDVVLVKKAPAGYEPDAYEGNHLLHVLLGAQIRVALPGADETMKEQIAEQLRREGRRPSIIGIGGNTPHGIAGYVDAVRELAGQARELDINVDYIVHASGSGGTQAGTVIGAKLHGDGAKVVCSTTGSRTAEQGRRQVMDLIGETTRCFDLDVEVTPTDIALHDYALGYGYVTPAKLQAIELAARTEGLILDPVYTGPAMACLIDHCRNGTFGRSDVVVFIHTGGQAGLFPYHAPLKAHGLGQPLPWTVPPWHPVT